MKRDEGDEERMVDNMVVNWMMSAKVNRESRKELEYD